MANGQMPGLAGLAQGLRMAGGILSPSAREANLEEDKLQQQQAQQMKLAQIQQTVKGIEMGAIEPEAGRAVLKQLGFEAPVGPGPEAIARQEAVQRKREMATAMSKLPPDASMEDRITAMFPHFEPAQQVAAFNAVTTKRETLAARTLQLEQAHEARMARLTDQRERDAELSAYRQQRLEIDRQNASATSTWRELQAEMARDRAAQGRERETARREGALDRQVTALGRAVEMADLGTANAVMKNAENAFLAAPDAADYISGPKSLLPDRAVSKEIATARRAIAKVFNIQLKDRSGAAVTPPEFERLKEEWGRGAFKTGEQILGAMEEARRIMEEHGLSVAAGYGPEVLKVYNENLVGVGGTPFIGGEKVTPLRQRMKDAQAAANAAPTRTSVTGANETTQITRGGAPVPVGGGEIARVRSDADFEALPSGTEFIGPDGRRRRKP